MDIGDKHIAGITKVQGFMGRDMSHFGAIENNKDLVRILKSASPSTNFKVICGHMCIHVYGTDRNLSLMPPSVRRPEDKTIATICEASRSTQIG